VNQPRFASRFYSRRCGRPSHHWSSWFWVCQCLTARSGQGSIHDLGCRGRSSLRGSLGTIYALQAGRKLWFVEREIDRQQALEEVVSFLIARYACA